MKATSSLLALALTAALGIVTASCSKSDNNDIEAANGAVNNTALANDRDNWKTVSAQNFSVDLPQTWTYSPISGMDTYNGIFSDKTDSLTYEYGIAPDSFRVDPTRYTFHYEVIDGKKAKVLSGAGYGIVIDDMGDPSKPQRRFVMIQASSSNMDEGTAMQIIRSVKFQKQ